MVYENFQPHSMERIMKGILPVLGLTVYSALAIGDFFFKPEMLFIPASLAVTGGLLLGAPFAVRRFLRPAPLPLAGAAAGAAVLLAASAGLLAWITPEALRLYAILQLFALNLALSILSAVILRQERG